MGSRVHHKYIAKVRTKSGKIKYIYAGMKSGLNNADRAAGKFYHDKIMRDPGMKIRTYGYDKKGRLYNETTTERKSKNARKLSDYAKGALGISRNKYERRYKAAQKEYSGKKHKASWYYTKEGQAYSKRVGRELVDSKRALDRYNRRKGYNTRWTKKRTYN